MRTPDYVLKEAHIVKEGLEYKTLPAGTFVRPIHIKYVPKHVLEDERWEDTYNPSWDVWAYTSIGIVPIPKNKIREV